MSDRQPGGHGPVPDAKARDRRRVVRRLWGYLRAYARRLVAVTVLVAIVTGLQLFGPYLQGEAIDRAIVPGDLHLLLRYVVALVLLYAAISALSLFQQWAMVRLGQDFIRRLRGDLFGRIQYLPLRFHDSHAHGDTMSRVTNDVDTVDQTVTASVPQLISSALMIVGVAGVMVAVNWRLAIVTMITIPLVALLTRGISKRTRSSFKAQRTGIGKLNGTIEESVAGFNAIVLFRQQERRLAQFERENQDVREQSVRAQIYAGLMGPVMNLMRNIGYAIVALAGGYFAVKGWATIGVVVIFIQYARQFTRPLNDIAQLYNAIQSALAGAERIFDTMDDDPEPADSGTGDLTKEPKRVEFRDVSFAYLPDRPVLREVSVTAEPGQTVALVGPTGAGKTTIINLLARFYDVDSGAIRVDGRDIRDLPRDSLRRSLGVVLQDTFLFSETVMENIRYGRLDATDEEVIEAAKIAYADHFIVHLPDGYATKLSDSGSNLSQGQRQLLSIARAVLSDPTILILDEATSNVDTRTEVHIQKAMRRLMHGRTTFVIAHRLNTVRNADRIVVISDGRVVEQGTHDELIALGGVYAELHESQFAVG